MSQPRRNVTYLDPVTPPASAEPLRKTPHCYGPATGSSNRVRAVGTGGMQVVSGLHDRDSDCTFCTSTGGNHSQSCPRADTGTVEKWIRLAHKLLTESGFDFSPSKVSRLVRQYQRNRASLPAEIARVIAYTDPTGEDATRHVMRERGF